MIPHMRLLRTCLRTFYSGEMHIFSFDSEPDQEDELPRMNFSPTPEEGYSGLLQNNRLQSPKHLSVNFRCLGTKNNQAKVLRNPAKNEFQVSQSSSKTKDLESIHLQFWPCLISLAGSYHRWTRGGGVVSLWSGKI